MNLTRSRILILRTFPEDGGRRGGRGGRAKFWWSTAHAQTAEYIAVADDGLQKKHVPTPLISTDLEPRCLRCSLNWVVCYRVSTQSNVSALAKGRHPSCYYLKRPGTPPANRLHMVLSLHKVAFAPASCGEIRIVAFRHRGQPRNRGRLACGPITRKARVIASR